MIILEKKYRSNYTGEHVVIERVLENGTWESKLDFIPNRVTNNQTSNRAVVFGNGVGRIKAETSLIINHGGGLLGSKKVQTYACNAFYRNYTPDFLVVTNKDIADEIISAEYHRTNIVYTGIRLTLDYPKSFYLIPYDIYSDAGTTAIYLSAFDGHKHIYMFGIDNQDTPNWNNNIYADTNGYGNKRSTVLDDKWINDKIAVFNTYDDVDFVLVTETGRQRIPESWKYVTNLRQISYRDFNIEVDL